MKTENPDTHTLRVTQLFYYRQTETVRRLLSFRTGHQWARLYSPTGDMATLNEFAKSIGCKPEWMKMFPGPSHYLLTPFARERAVKAGAVEVTAEEWTRELDAWRAKFQTAKKG